MGKYLNFANVLLIKGVIVQGTWNGAFIVGSIARTELLSRDTDDLPVTLLLPPSTFHVVQSPMAKHFQAEVVSNLLCWVSSSINLVFVESTKLCV